MGWDSCLLERRLPHPTGVTACPWLAAPLSPATHLCCLPHACSLPAAGGFKERDDEEAEAARQRRREREEREE